MKFQDSSFNGLKVILGTKGGMHTRSKSNMPHQLFQSWGHNDGLHDTCTNKYNFKLFLFETTEKACFRSRQQLV